jgi:hypothetical protein
MSKPNYLCTMCKMDFGRKANASGALAESETVVGSGNIVESDGSEKIYFSDLIYLDIRFPDSL